jgi:exosortase/archaeosortase family protein
VLLAEGGLTSKLPVRLVGLALVLAPALVWDLTLGTVNPSDYLAMEVAAGSFVFVAYGSLLLVNPLMWRIMLPYASLYALGLTSPLFLINELGTPLAAFTGSATAAVTSVLGPSVAWQGVSFSFVSRTGETITSVITPACSAAYSISIFLALLGLMKLDSGGSTGTTLKFALIGLVTIPLLDAARIVIMIWSGFLDGASVYWGMHDWLGYGMFLGFYIAVMVAYSRSSRQPRSGLASMAASGLRTEL